jgi:integrase
MAKPADGVYRRSDSTQWQWRIKAPADLQSAYGNKQWAHGCSLRTSDVREANRKAALLRAEWLQRFDRQRNQPQPQRVEAFTSEVIELLAETVKHQLLHFDLMVRVDPRSWFTENEDHHEFKLTGMPDPVADAAAKFNRGALTALSQALARGRLTEGKPFLVDAAQRLQLAVDEQAEGYPDALRACLTAAVEAYTLGTERDKGAIVKTPDRPKLKPVEKPKFLRDVFDRWKGAKDETSDNVKKKTAALKLYEEQTGNPALSELTRDQGEAFKTYPLKGTGASKTKHDRLDAVKTLLNYGRRDLRWIPDNPWEGLDIPYRTEKKRRPWTDDQIQRFFTLPLFAKYELPKPTTRNGSHAAYWIPLLGLYTGARVGELSQLRVVDVTVAEGVPVLSINEESENATVKSEAGIREVPIHSELLRLGFLQYVEQQRAAGEERLWPLLKLRKNRPGGYFSLWFGETRRSVANVPDFHSLRHTVRSKMANTAPSIPVQIQDRITGHETKGSTGQLVYSHFPVASLKAAIEAVRYGLKLPRVFQPSPTTEQAEREASLA